MKITDSWLVDFIDRKEQGRIPIFQRAYSWGIGDCKKLLDDIINVGSDKKRNCHFIGSIIYEDIGRESGVALKSIVDGQQRLTTVSLLMLALLDYCKIFYPKPTAKSKDIENQLRGYLFNDVQKTGLQNKLLFNGDDDFVYQELLNDREKCCQNINSKYAENYRFLYRQLVEQKINPQVYLNGIQKLKIVDILVEEKDDANVIFETVNGTGLELTGAELIKNYILMTVPSANQNNLYVDSWRPMELSLGSDFSKFFRYYLITVKCEEIGDKPKQYYDEFKSYAAGKKTEDLVRKEICVYYTCYDYWKNCSKRPNENDKLTEALFRVRHAEAMVFTPVVLHMLFKIKSLQMDIDKEADINNQKKKIAQLKKIKNETISILNIMEIYLVRLSLCEIDSKNIGDIWLKMLKALVQSFSVKSIYKVLDSVKNTNQRMPTDAELDTSLQTYPIYKKKRWCRYVLEKIEKQMNKDYYPDSQLTIEHIYPQTPKTKEELDRMDKKQKLKYDWASTLGADLVDIETYKHTLGNLTLSGYNSDYQNFVFKVKRDMGSASGEEKKGYKYSSIKMTAYLKKYKKWGKDEIISRTALMGEYVKRIWPYPLEISNS